MRISNLSAAAVVAGLCFVSAPASAIDLDLAQVSSIIVTAGNNPVSVNTATLGLATVNADTACQLEFSSSVSAGVLTVEPIGSNQIGPVSLVIPANFPNVKIDSANGGITFSGNLQRLEISGANGSATITNSAFDALVVNNTNGPILLDTVSAKATKLKSSNAAVTISRLTSPFAINAVNGRIRMSNVTVPHGSRNSISKVNGSVAVSGVKVIPAKGELKARLKLTTKTVNGSVRVLKKNLSNRRRTLLSELGKGRNSAKLSITTVNADILVK